MSENNKIADRAEKILFVVCATFLGVLFVFFRFGGMDAMKGNCCRFWCRASVITGALFLISTVITLFVCCYGDDGGADDGVVSCRERPFLRKFTRAEEWNKTYWVDSSNMNDKIPKGRTIIFVKDDADFSGIKFAEPGKISEIYFCASEPKVSAKQLQELQHANFFLDCGKTKITIEPAAQESADGGAAGGNGDADSDGKSAGGRRWRNLLWRGRRGTDGGKSKKSAKEQNRTYWVDSSNIEKEIPKGRTIIFVKDDVDFSGIKFAKPDKISEIHFCASKLKVSAKQLQELQHADFSLDCGKTKSTTETVDGGGVPCREWPCLRKFTGAEEQNKTYWIDSSNMNDKIPKGRTIIFVKDDADFRKIKFAEPGKISEIHFCASEPKVSAKQLQELQHANFFLDCGKTKITIEPAAQES